MASWVTIRRRLRGFRGERRGSAVIETALVLLPLFAMSLGIMDFAMALFLRGTFLHAAREGVRYAVTYQTVQGMGHDASIRQVVQNNAMGFLAGTAGANMIRIRYYDPITFAETSSNSPGNLIEISIEGFRYSWMAPVMRGKSALNMTARAMDRMEGLPGGSNPPVR